jgi:hypothetical protein
LRLTQAMQQVPVRILLPSQQIRAVFTNQTAAAGLFDCYLVGHPIGGDF